MHSSSLEAQCDLCSPPSQSSPASSAHHVPHGSLAPATPAFLPFIVRINTLPSFAPGVRSTGLAPSPLGLDSNVSSVDPSLRHQGAGPYLKLQPSLLHHLPSALFLPSSPGCPTHGIFHYFPHPPTECRLLQGRILCCFIHCHCPVPSELCLMLSKGSMHFC